MGTLRCGPGGRNGGPFGIPAQTRAAFGWHNGTRAVGGRVEHTVLVPFVDLLLQCPVEEQLLLRQWLPPWGPPRVAIAPFTTMTTNPQHNTTAKSRSASAPFLKKNNDNSDVFQLGVASVVDGFSGFYWVCAARLGEAL